MPSKRKPASLASELFEAVQGAQGKGFVSDGLEAIDTNERLFGMVRGHLKHTQRAARIIRKWLKKYDEL